MSVGPTTVGPGGRPSGPAESPRTRAPSLATAPVKRRSFRRSALLRLLETPSSAIGLFIVVFWVGCAIFWPFFAPYDPAAQDYGALLGAPSRAHLFGTDHIGRDVLSRVLAGSREVLLLAPAATALGIVGGIIVGLSAAYYGGWFDEIVMRIMDAVMAFPFIILVLLILSVLGSSTRNVILVIGLGFIPLTGRVVRAAALSVRQLDYIAAARLRGASGPNIMLTELLPNVTGPIVVEATVRIGYAIFAAASLSFLGLGVPPPSSNWGAMINETHVYLTINPAMVLAPTLAIGSLVVAVNLVADGLRRVVRA
ncbi:MAG: ABC transporter permease [Chloroflexia bacterium]|nr:ABC transporter permease [Chloroflexia bacterium]